MNSFNKHRFSKLLLFLLLITPAVWSFFVSNQRAADVSIFHPDDNWAAMATRRLELINSGWPPELARLVSNKITSSGKIFLKNYASYFGLDFLFIKGPAEATYGMLAGIGVLYLMQLPFLAVFVILNDVGGELPPTPQSPKSTGDGEYEMPSAP